jgi:hypothetical protein
MKSPSIRRSRLGVKGAGAEALGPLPDGSVNFRVRAVDAAGNVDASPDSRSFVIDTDPASQRFTV